MEKWLRDYGIFRGCHDYFLLEYILFAVAKWIVVARRVAVRNLNKWDFCHEILELR